MARFSSVSFHEFNTTNSAAVGTIYCLWGFLFSHFRMADHVDPARTWLWEMLHYPLHFGLFMLTAAIGVSWRIFALCN
jgi:hypothetical protein